MGSLVSLSSMSVISEQATKIMVEIIKYINKDDAVCESKLYDECVQLIKLIPNTFSHLIITEENVNNTSFCLDYFDDFPTFEFKKKYIENIKNLITEQDENKKWKNTINNFEFSLRPIIMLILCFMHHYNKKILFEKLVEIINKFPKKDSEFLKEIESSYL